ncbi:MAG TPA: DUF2079 domain-containing protein [Acidimicrobiales bacterium]|nr:DUF2079 domain-containing protein [Acidimicrobiales bacterium]
MRGALSRRPPKPGLFPTICVVLVAAQLVVLILYSWYLYRRFDLLEDFAHNAQAWYLIAHGNALPLDTVRYPSTPFLRDHFDLVMWPLSLLHILSGSPFWLLVVQDIAVAAAELITLRWVWTLLTVRLDRHRTVAGLLALLVLMANAWWYETVSFDIHLTPLGLPLLVLVGYWLWNGRWTRACLAAAGCLLFGAVVTELLLFVGLGVLIALLARRPRDRRGLVTTLVVSVVAGAWVLVVTGVGANQASNLASQYSYLVADNGHAGTFALLSGVLRHPVRALRMLSSRSHAMVRPLITSGLVGILSPIGLLVSFGTLVPAGLAVSPSFSSVNDSFQTLAVIPFVLVGDVIVLLWLGARLEAGSPRSAPSAAAPRRLPTNRGAIVWGLACLLALSAVVQDARLLVHLRQTWWTVTPSGAVALHRALDHAPPSDEVIASNGVVGRFSQRRYVYPLQLSPQTLPLKASKVVLVIATAGNEALSRAQVVADLRFVRVHLGAHTISRGEGVSTFGWDVPQGQTSVTFP